MPPFSLTGVFLAGFLFLENAKFVPAPGPLHLLFSLLGMIFSQVAFHVGSLSLRTHVNVTSLEGPSSIISIPPPTHLFVLFSS